MSLTTNSSLNSQTNPVITVTLETVQDFTLEQNQKCLYIFNLNSESVEVLIKGTRSIVNIASLGELNINNGQSIPVLAKSLCKIEIPLNYKNWGEYGDKVTISSASNESFNIICWLTE